MIGNKMFEGRLWYFEPYKSLIGRWVDGGAAIGTAQDVSEKYGGGMLAHVHFQIDKVNPLLLMEL